jgi:radical SAM-linked protein
MIAKKFSGRRHGGRSAEYTKRFFTEITIFSIPAPRQRRGAVEPMVRIRVRMVFGKRDDLRWVGHRDLMRLMERMFRRADLPLGRSEGFHPKPRMTFPLPLAVGLTGGEEVMEFELSEALAAEEIRNRLAPQLPRGLTLRRIEAPAPGPGKVRVRSAAYAAPIPPSRRPELPERIRDFLAQEHCPIARSRGRPPLDVRPLVEDLVFREDVLQMRLRNEPSGSAGPREVLSALGLDGLEAQGVVLSRTAVEVTP